MMLLLLLLSVTLMFVNEKLVSVNIRTETKVIMYTFSVRVYRIYIHTTQSGDALYISHVVCIQ